MAGKKRTNGNGGGEKGRRMAHERETRPRGHFERPAGPEATNRDHPDQARDLKTVPGAGIVSAGREGSVNDENSGTGRMAPGAARPGTTIVSTREGMQGHSGGAESASPGERGTAVETSSTGATERLHPGATPPNDSARDAAAETNDPNFSAQRAGRAAPRDAGVVRMDTSGRTADQQPTRSRNPRLVRDIMTADVEVCNPDTEMYYVGRMMMERDCGAIPVVESTDSMRPVGIVTDRDVVVRVIARNQNPLNMRARDCMSTDLASVWADALVEECVLMMEDRQLRRVLVVDNTGRLCGIVAQADVARMRDEQVVGELLREVSEPGMSADRDQPPPT